MRIEIDTCITHEFVYQVDVEVTADKIKSYVRTTFNKMQPEVAINRAIRQLKINPASVEAVKIKMVQQLGNSQL